MTDMLYHYCSLDTLIKILDSNSIWMTELTQANDHLEGKLASQGLIDLVIKQTIEVSSTTRQETAESIKSTCDNFESAIRGFATCFSEAPDKLSQWRGYANDGKGISIGFDKERLRSLLERNRAQLIEAIYDPAEQERVITEYNTHLPESTLGYLSLDTTRVPERKQQQDTAKLSLASSLMTYNYQFKQEGFSEEQEWRVFSKIAINSPHRKTPINFFAKDDRIIPYQTLGLGGSDCHPITEIYIGPKCLTDAKVITALLIKYGIKGVEVKSSTISYR